MIENDKIRFSRVNFCFLILSFWGFLILLFLICSFHHFAIPISIDYQYITNNQQDFKKKIMKPWKNQRNSSKLLSWLRHKSLPQGTLRWDLYGCSSLVIPYHHTILILRGCHSPCHFSWWRQRYHRNHHRLYSRSSIWFSSRNGRQDYQLSAG